MLASSKLANLTALLNNSQEPAVNSQPDFWHSHDYREIRTGGEVHFLTRNQAAVIRLIHLEHLKGCIDAEGAWVLRQVKCFCTRMAEVFRYSSVWGTVLVASERRGNYRLTPFAKENILSPKYHRRSQNSRRKQPLFFSRQQGRFNSTSACRYDEKANLVKSVT